jgi:hypothetical protein
MGKMAQSNFCEFLRDQREDLMRILQNISNFKFQSRQLSGPNSKL